MMLLTVLNNRWKLVIHGGVYGFSRKPVYIRFSGNNQASTVLELFKEAVAEYGLRSRVRSDKGGENTEVSLFMLSNPQRGPGRGNMFTGKSVHNQRIELGIPGARVGVSFFVEFTSLDLPRCPVVDRKQIHIYNKSFGEFYRYT